LAAPLKAADDNTPPRQERRHAGRRGERLLQQLQRETGIYWRD
jgi:hypothetical protein